MTNAVAVVAEERGALAEQVAVVGDLAQLTPQQRMAYYSRVCESLGINPYTQPFQYIRLNNKLVLYATRTAADQLRKRNGVSLDAPDIQFADGLVIVTVTGRAADGRTDTEIGAVPLGNLQGEARANAIMKAVTKAKRRLTLSICGLGWLDETEVETIRDARPVTVTDDGEIVDEPPGPSPSRPAQSTPPANGKTAAQAATDLGPPSDEDTAISEANGDFANVAADFLGTDALTIKRRMGELKLSVPRTGQQRIEVYHALKADLGAADDLMGDVTGQPLLVTVDDKQAGREYQQD